MNLSAIKKAFKLLIEMYIIDYNKKLPNNIRTIMLENLHISLFFKEVSESDINELY